MSVESLSLAPVSLEPVSLEPVPVVSVPVEPVLVAPVLVEPVLDATAPVVSVVPPPVLVVGNIGPSVVPLVGVVLVPGKLLAEVASVVPPVVATSVVVPPAPPHAATSNQPRPATPNISLVITRQMIANLRAAAIGGNRGLHVGEATNLVACHGGRSMYCFESHDPEEISIKILGALYPPNRHSQARAHSPPLPTMIVVILPADPDTTGSSDNTDRGRADP